MACCQGVGAVLLGAILVLPALAYASPPDQTWITGYWDDADYDDVVLLVTSTCSTIAPDPTPDSGPTSTVVATVILEPPATPGSPLRLPTESRAPPIA